MRRASLSSTTAQRQERLRRDRAAAQAVRVAFPSVTQIRLELTFEGISRNIPASQSHILHPPAQAFFQFPCPYSDCDGEFDLTAAVKAALSEAPRPARGMLECHGQRVAAGTAVQRCNLHLHYTVSAQRSA